MKLNGWRGNGRRRQPERPRLIAQHTQDQSCPGMPYWERLALMLVGTFALYALVASCEVAVNAEHWSCAARAVFAGAFFFMAVMVLGAE